MKNITVKNYQGKEFSGAWNGQVYSSKVDDQSDLLRIYLNGQALHITKEEHERISEDAALELKEKSKRDSLNAKIIAKEQIEKMTQQDKYELASRVIFDLIKELNPDTDEFDEIRKPLIHTLNELEFFIK